MKQANLGLSDQELGQRQLDLQQQARTLSSKYRLLESLGQAGKAKMTGSAQLGLMVWPDLDFEVATDGEPEFDSVLRVIQQLNLAGVRNVYLKDQRGAGLLPDGIYLGPKIEFNGTWWQVDVWFMDEEAIAKRRETSDILIGRLTDESRMIILRLKQAVAANSKYHDEISSMDIYRAVLDEQVASIEQFETYIAKSGRSL